MNSFQVFFAILGAVLYLVGFVPYVYHIFHGRVVPHAFSWTVWAILSSINTYILIDSQGLDYSITSPLVRSMALVVGAVIAWFFIHKVRISHLDRVSILLAVLCLCIAYVYGASNAIIPTILVDILVLIPTLKKIWNNPDSEDAWAWILVVFSQMATLISLGHYTWENSLFWAYVMCENALVALFIIRRRIAVHHWRWVLVHIRDKITWR